MNRITDPSRKYLLVSRGDGYTTKIVSGAELDDAWLAMQYGSVSYCPEDERRAVLSYLHNEDEWVLDYQYGPVKYYAAFEDGELEVILICGEQHG